jgi:hypothetical protein
VQLRPSRALHCRLLLPCTAACCCNAPTRPPASPALDPAQLAALCQPFAQSQAPTLWRLAQRALLHNKVSCSKACWQLELSLALLATCCIISCSMPPAARLIRSYLARMQCNYMLKTLDDSEVVVASSVRVLGQELPDFVQSCDDEPGSIPGQHKAQNLDMQPASRECSWSKARPVP